MFAATTTDTLSVADPTVLKKAPSSIPSCLDLIETPTASSWSPDNSFLYISSAHTIHRYEPSSNILRDVYIAESTETIQHIVAKDKSIVIFAAESTIHLLECGPNPEISQTFDSHKSTISSLSLSNDNTLLASTSAGAVHVHNLNLGSHTVLRGLVGQNINTSIFHPHSRTRLLVAAGKQLMVYDTTRPSAPVKVITLNESTLGDIACVACSPFSKTLVAVATLSGFVGLIDLEKEKALFRTLNVKTPLTTIAFSPEGAGMYLGTENGKLLIVDLRALDKPPKPVVISVNNSRIQTMTVQKKAKPGAEGPTKTPVGTSAITGMKTSSEAPRRLASNTVTQTSKSASKVAPSPARPRVGKPAVSASPVTRRVPMSVKESNAVSSPVILKSFKTTGQKKVLSPVRDPHGNSGGTGDISVQLDELANLRRGKAHTTPIKNKRSSTDTLRVRPSPSPRGTTISAGKVASSKTVDGDKPRRARTLPTTTASTTQTRKASAVSITDSAPTNDCLHAPRVSPHRRPRAVSSASRAGAEPISSISSGSSRPARLATTTSASSASASRPSSSASRPGSSISHRSKPYVTSGLARGYASRTPSPDLPNTHLDPVTPVPAQKHKKAAMGVLGLGTPEVDRWIRAGQQEERKKRNKDDVKVKGKTVGFKDDSDDDQEHGRGDDNDDDEEERERERERERNLSLQISPRRPAPGASTSRSGSTESWTASPALHQSGVSPSTGNGGGGGGSSSAHELLKTIVQDVMYDFQQETKDKMTGLHLDLLRMGRGWKTELRTLMDEYVGDLRDLREENHRLRAENERLRRNGY